jgi:uncharacterized membrane protein YqgA involved in biofilm formation
MLAAAVRVEVLLQVLAVLAAAVMAQQVEQVHRERLIQVVARAVQMLVAVQPVVTGVLALSSLARLLPLNMLRVPQRLPLLVAESFTHSPRLARLCSEVNDGTLCSIR